ncbi:MAG: hypothetical protein KA004_16230 [Verrucomicrobiales bacterium]|nr:hypothetical protein [Verrucomicrobiales bacterium]
MPAATAPPSTGTRLRFQCGACKSLLEVPEQYAGITAPCPHCGSSVTAPAARESPGHSQASPAPAPAIQPPQVPKPKPAEDLLAPEPPSPTTAVKARIGHGPNLPKILGWASLALAIGAAAFLFAISRYSVPTAPRAKEIVIPRDLTTQVLWQKENMEALKQHAVSQSLDAVRRFLKQEADTGGGTLLHSFAATPPRFEFPLFPDLDPEALATATLARKPGTDEFWTTVEPTDGKGPVFIVEETAGSAKIHADALAQQVDDLWNAFLDHQDSPAVILYASARPFQGQFPLPELEAWTKVDLIPPFPQDVPRAFVACAAPGSKAADDLLRRRPDAGWGRLVLELRWGHTASSKPFIEIIRTIPGAWTKY